MPFSTGAPDTSPVAPNLSRVPFPACLIDVEGSDFRFRSVNAAMERAAPQIASALAGTRIADRLPPDLARQVYDACRACCERRVRHIFHIETKTTSWRGALTPLEDRNGQVVSLYAQAIARPHRKQAPRNDPATGTPSAHLSVEASDHNSPPQGFERRMRFEDLCAEICAELVDDTQFRVSFGEAEILADRFIVYGVLRALLSRVTAAAQKWIEIDIESGPPGVFTLIVRDDRSDHPSQAQTARLTRHLGSHAAQLTVHASGRWHIHEVQIPGAVVTLPNAQPSQQIAL